MSDAPEPKGVLTVLMSKKPEAKPEQDEPTKPEPESDVVPMEAIRAMEEFNDKTLSTGSQIAALKLLIRVLR